MVMDAPLGEKANPGLSPNPAKAPWYFMGIQEMLMHFHPLFAVLIIPAITVLAAILLPYKNYDSAVSTAGVWFISEKGRSMAKISALTGFLVTCRGVLVGEY
jgi:quinol-cytochrome oxidoreductase complex cytochrome b subunit